MKKNSTTKPNTRRAQVARARKLTIGIDLGDRVSRYCILNEEGEVIFEGSVPTTKSGMNQVFGAMPRCRIAMETGAHSPWVSRQLSEFGHEVIVANARNVRLICITEAGGRRGRRSRVNTAGIRGPSSGG